MLIFLELSEVRTLSSLEGTDGIILCFLSEYVEEPPMVSKAAHYWYLNQTHGQIILLLLFFVIKEKNLLYGV